jgi:hypothetical protein
MPESTFDRATVEGRRARKAHIWAKHPDNWYVEEQWCSTRLFETVRFDGEVHDPCCGMGYIPLAALKAGYHFTASDIEDRTHTHNDWWFTKTRYQDDERMHDNIVTNPPFDDINKKPWPFIEWALSHVRYRVALLVPFKWLAGDARSRLLETKPITRILVLTPRPSMPPGNVLLAMRERGEKPSGGKEDFAWVIFEPISVNRVVRPEFGWLHRDKDA